MFGYFFEMSGSGFENCPNLVTLKVLLKGKVFARFGVLISFWRHYWAFVTANQCESSLKITKRLNCKQSRCVWCSKSLNSLENVLFHFSRQKRNSRSVSPRFVANGSVTQGKQSSRYRKTNSSAQVPTRFRSEHTSRDKSKPNWIW